MSLCECVWKRRVLLEEFTHVGCGGKPLMLPVPLGQRLFGCSKCAWTMTPDANHIPIHDLFSLVPEVFDMLDHLNENGLCQWKQLQQWRNSPQ